MELTFSADDAAFRDECRTWLAEHVPAEPLPSGDTRAGFALHLDWERTLFADRWSVVSWPTEYGGRGASLWQWLIFEEEYYRAGAPQRVTQNGIFLLAPTIFEFGTPDQQARWLPRMAAAEDLWCQGWSEPNAGSDLAGLETRAERDGDEWVIHGQKVWTSHAHAADWGILLARSNPDVPKHRGITCFLVDMRAPGIEVRPLRQATGSAEFNEVFLDGLHLSDDDRLGPVDDGWRVAMTTLTSERVSIGGNTAVLSLDDLVALADRRGLRDDAPTRQALVGFHTRVQLITYLAWRLRSAVSAGREPGPESSVLKLAMSRHQEATGDLIMGLLGADATLDHADAYGGGSWQGHFLYQWASRLGGGTDQVQRTVIGERVLGLPGEPRTDKGLTFRQLQRAALDR